MIRYEIEKKLIEGSIEVKDLKNIWNDAYKKYLNVEVKSDKSDRLYQRTLHHCFCLINCDRNKILCVTTLIIFLPLDVVISDDMSYCGFCTLKRLHG